VVGRGLNLSMQSGKAQFAFAPQSVFGNFDWLEYALRLVAAVEALFAELIVVKAHA